MNLRAEVLTRMSADSAAIDAFLAAANNYSKTIASQIPWPYSLLEWTPQDEAPEPVRRVVAVVHDNVEWLRGVVNEHGWPGKSVVGEDGMDAFWLLLQHAGSGVPTIGTPANLAFQASCIPLLHQAVQAGEAHPRHLAHIVDNQRERTNQLPDYAVMETAFALEDDELVLRPGLDADTINDNRAQIGLLPLSVDLERRRTGNPPDATDGTRPEPWPSLTPPRSPQARP
ncbi:hypothetical protein GCM10029976_014730 [Kribbella albertanoniae]|uniref:Uncharacterized protein n=1 Tax=Kribbella albertanoniae TaxID=1266829 RepID=A0A4R4PKV1_9ACTN|nr:DUF6624 domain-containing protein [Kribbella albertanoniae]TDC22603.1 hypothetical protein E1261_30460 [Kribbella albertanoniae]